MKPNTPVTHIAAALLAVPAQATETENQPPLTPHSDARPGRVRRAGSGRNFLAVHLQPLRLTLCWN
jgi:hypothetical protein